MRSRNRPALWWVHPGGCLLAPQGERWRPCGRSAGGGRRSSGDPAKARSWPCLSRVCPGPPSLLPALPAAEGWTQTWKDRSKSPEEGKETHLRWGSLRLGLALLLSGCGLGRPGRPTVPVALGEGNWIKAIVFKTVLSRALRISARTFAIPQTVDLFFTMCFPQYAFFSLSIYSIDILTYIYISYVSILTAWLRYSSHTSISRVLFSGFSVLMELYSRRHYVIFEHFHQPEKEPSGRWQPFRIPTLLTPSAGQPLTRGVSPGIGLFWAVRTIGIPQYVLFCDWLLSPHSYFQSSSILELVSIARSFYGWILLSLTHPFMSCWTCGLFSNLGYWELCCFEPSCANFYVRVPLFLLGYN